MSKNINWILKPYQQCLQPQQQLQWNWNNAIQTTYRGDKAR